MTKSTRTRLWNADINKDYWRDKKIDQARAEAARKGEPVAERIDEVLAGLLPDERDFIEYLVLSGIRKIVAKYEIDLMQRLVSKKLMQLRPGVGTRFMHDYDTSFSFPDAVWDVLDDRRETIFDLGDRSAAIRIRDLEKALGSILADITPITRTAPTANN
jgi:hypothetical protein